MIKKKSLIYNKWSVGCLSFFGIILFIILLLIFIPESNYERDSIGSKADDMIQSQGKKSNNFYISKESSKSEIISYYKDSMLSHGLCSTSFSVALDSFQNFMKQKSSINESKKITNEAKEICKSSNKNILRRKQPTDISENAKKSFDQAIASCFASTVYSEESLSFIIQILDGNRDGNRDESMPEKLSKKIEDTNASSTICTEFFILGVSSSGIPIENLK